MNTASRAPWAAVRMLGWREEPGGESGAEAVGGLYKKA
jgi:hypothetical protein